MRLPLILVVCALLPLTVHAYEPGSTGVGEFSRYTFSWPIGEGSLKPRGASTKGAEVTLDTEPAEEWKRLHAAGLSNFERDRRAILAMAGPHRVSFDLAYQGSNVWVLRKIPDNQRRGAWVQSVYQVDDSPRYAASGRWQHSDSFSTWISDETWRPLPRREWSVRNDYQVLLGTNRHTITPSGWMQEENNLKLALDETGKPRATMPYLAREYGVARYQRIKDYDFAPGQDYFEKTEPFWAEVRAAWRKISLRGRFKLVKPVDQGQLFVPFFEYAERLTDGQPFVREDARAFIEETLRRSYLAPT
jgi:hypothetical protein